MTKRKPSLSPARRKTCLQNFTQYRLNGMIGSLHTIYYERRNESPMLQSAIGVVIDALEQLKNTFKEHDNG
jgi:hypothetical protein